MNRFFVDFDGRVFNKSIDITGEDVNHIKNVLRLKVNDEIIICLLYTSPSPRDA